MNYVIRMNNKERYLNIYQKVGTSGNIYPLDGPIAYGGDKEWETKVWERLQGFFEALRDNQQALDYIAKFGFEIGTDKDGDYGLQRIKGTEHYDALGLYAGINKRCKRLLVKYKIGIYS